MLRKALAWCISLGICGALLILAGRSGSGLAQTAQDKQGGGAQQADETPAPTQVRSAGLKNAPPNSLYLEELNDEVRTAPGAAVLSNGDSYDDFVSVAQTSDGTLLAAYAAYYDGHDQIRLHRKLADGWWSARTYVPLAQARSDIWMPQLACDAQDRIWLIWSEQTGQSRGKTGNWDLYARPMIGDRWGNLVRLTEDPKPDINPHVTVDADHNIHVVWQAHPENQGDIQYCRFDGQNWSKPLAVTSDEQSDWYPHVAVDNDGTAWIAFDSYRNGDYDVYLTSVQEGKPGVVIPIASSSYYEAHASVACDSAGRVWLAWEQGGHNWGKDQGYWLRRNNRNMGTSLGSGREVKVACWQDGTLYEAPAVAAAVPDRQQQRPRAHAEIAVGTDDRVWLRFRNLFVRAAARGNRARRGWVESVTWLTPDGWAEVQTLPASPGRISVFSRILPTSDGGLAIGYSSDARSVDNLHRPIQDTALVCEIAAPEQAVGVPDLAEYSEPPPPAAMPAWNSGLEERHVAAIRNYRTDINDVSHQIVRGDLHRHTELSWDVGPGNDGSYLDFYRYMIDVAAMDFGGLTDHQGGGHYPYWWWLTEKSADMYYLKPRFVPLYGYERSVTFPNGHRNIFHAYRGVPVFPFQVKLGTQGVFPGIGTGNVVENDTKLLYNYLHGTEGLAISHTSGTSSMGTDWRDNDPWVEPVVEIYQGARNSYEALDAPRVHPSDEPPGRAPGGYQEAGLIWNAYKKGYRLGTTASSDHGSTHISYSMVFTPENDRQAIIDSIRKRQTYGATDNLIVEFRVNGEFMGREIKSTQHPQLSLQANGTGRIAKLDLIRNYEYIYSGEPNKESVTFQYVDAEPQAGLNLYYFRLVQDNGEVAWSSPVWVNYEQ